MLTPPESFQVPREGSTLIGDRWPGHGPTLVLLHAGVCDRRSWNGVVPLLREAGTVITYDRRGFGDSPPSNTTFSHLQDLLAVVDALATGPVWLVGSSMGGGLALDAALTAPERVAGLVLLAPGVSGAPEPEELDPATQRLSDALDAATDADDVDLVNRLEVQVWLDGPAAREDRVTGPARELALAMNTIVLQHAEAEDAGDSGVDAWSRLGEIGAPTTIACGDLDVPYLLEQCEQLLTRIPGARRATLPGTAHLPYLERPDLVAAVITSAL
ncbi:alpha/beta fold hydrolase [Kineococcus sp. R8]|uniref:alpha/beta fold hydrolase n=1 Tax=Kineococcus siccus TaxID=2696567 RepID=UPI0014133B29|nr:alpha/beta fold hydrolase [Kineococcus siccus]